MLLLPKWWSNLIILYTQKKYYTRLYQKPPQGSLFTDNFFFTKYTVVLWNNLSSNFIAQRKKAYPPIWLRPTKSLPWALNLKYLMIVINPISTSLVSKSKQLNTTIIMCIFISCRSAKTSGEKFAPPLKLVQSAQTVTEEKKTDKMMRQETGLFNYKRRGKNGFVSPPRKRQEDPSALTRGKMLINFGWNCNQRKRCVVECRPTR